MMAAGHWWEQAPEHYWDPPPGFRSPDSDSDSDSERDAEASGQFFGDILDGITFFSLALFEF